MRKNGFTLIELMIVVAIIAIIAAIAIPNLFTSKMSANETNAISALRTLVTCEATWRQQDSDGNGKLDYWTYDVSGFYRILLGDGATKIALIDVAFAKADQYPTVQAILGATVIASDLTLTAKAGYTFGALSNSAAGVPYCQANNTIGRGTSPATAIGNDFIFAFSAAPASYATSGVLIFIVNHMNSIYSVDAGGEANKWAIGGGATGGNSGDNIWPSRDPTTVDRTGSAVGTPQWTIVQ